MKRKDLVTLLELVNPAVSASGLVPVFGCFMFTKGGISAFNGDALAISAKFDNEIVFAAEGRTLLGLLQNSKAEAVSITVEKNDIRIAAGKSNFKMPYLKEDDFLFEEPKEKWAATAELTTEMIEGIKIALTTTSRDNSMPALMGICFNFDETDLTTIYSCDGDAITRFMTADGYKGKGIYTTPNSFCDALLKIWHETQAVGGKIEFSCNWVKASLSTGFTVYGRVIPSDNSLDHADLISKTMNTESPFVELPDGLNEALARARVLADAESKPTLFTVYDGKLGLLTESKLGEARESLGLKGHDDVEASVFASLMQRSIGVCNKISIRENCTAFRLDDTVLQVVSNVGE